MPGESTAKSFITRQQGNTPKKIYSVFHFRVPILVGSRGGKCDIVKYMLGNVEDKTFISQIKAKFTEGTHGCSSAYTQHRRWKGLGCQRHAPAALPPGKKTGTLCT